MTTETTTDAPTMTTTEAIVHMRQVDSYRPLLVEAYLQEDTDAEVARFAASVELAHTLDLLPSIEGKDVLDLGAGTGLASRALAMAGARQVIALEPERDDVVGLGVLAEASDAAGVRPLAGLGGDLPLVDACVDVVYCRQVLHHIPNLSESLAECARVLRPGGYFVATREHVVDDAHQLAAFRAEHPVHQLAGGEGAWSLSEYERAITEAGLSLERSIGPWDSVINAFPTVRSDDELARAPEHVLALRGGPMLGRLGRLPGVRQLIWHRLRRPKPGRLYTFLAQKPPVDEAIS